MNVLLQSLVIVALVVPIIIGLLLGSMRGLRRSIIRIVLVALSIVLAFVLKGTITDQLMQIQVDGQPLIETVIQEMFQGQNIPTETMENIVTLLAMALIFLMSLGLFLFLTWAILFPLLKLFIRNKTYIDEKGVKKRKKHNFLSRLLGSVLGLAQGIAVAVVCVTILNGVFFNLSNIAATMNGMQGDSTTYATEQDGGNGSDEAAVDAFNTLMEYNESGIRKFINKMGGDKLFDSIVSFEKEEGKKITLTGQIDALRGLVEMGKELSAIQGMDMQGGLNADTASALQEIFNNLDAINSKLTTESKDAINTLVQAVANDMLNLDMDFSAVDFNTVSFANEGQVIAKLSTYKETDFSGLNETDAKQKAKDIVDTVMQSDIILPLLSSNGEFTIGLEGDSYDYAKNVIDELKQAPDADEKKIEMLEKFFGVSESQPEV